MVDKPRGPRRPGASPGKPAGRGPRAGGPEQRSAAFGPRAGKPEKGPAGPRKVVSGVDRKTLERMEEQGLLSNEGHRALDAARGLTRSPVKAKPTRGAEPRGAVRPGKLAAPGRAVGLRGKLTDAEATVAQRLHKVMAQAGVASRRHSEELIQAGRVTVNGQKVTELGMKVVPGRDLVEVDGRPLGKPESLVHIMLNKPKGYVTTLYDPQGRPKVTDLLGEDIAQRVYPVGRLDYETEGLLLMTNDGELANALMHPARMVKKTYIAKVRGVLSAAKIKALEEGIELDDGMTAPAEVKVIEVKAPNGCTLSMRIHEGRNRQVRRMLEAVGHEVIHLKRTTMGPLHLKELELGQWRYLTALELNELRKATGLKAAKLEGGPSPRRGAASRPGRDAAERPGRRPVARPRMDDEAGEAGFAPPARAFRSGPARGPAEVGGPRPFRADRPADGPRPFRPERPTGGPTPAARGGGRLGEKVVARLSAARTGPRPTGDRRSGPSPGRKNRGPK